MNGVEQTARRYQWLSRDNLDVVSDPHTGITCDQRSNVLNFVSKDSLGARDAVIEFTKEHPDAMIKKWNEITLEMPEDITSHLLILMRNA